MYQPVGSTIITTTRARWTEFVTKLTAIGRTETATFVSQQAGCWTLTSYPSIPLDRERLGLWHRLMHGPDCPACDGWGAVNGQPCLRCSAATDPAVA